MPVYLAVLGGDTVQMEVFHCDLTTDPISDGKCDRLHVMWIAERSDNGHRTEKVGHKFTLDGKLTEDPAKGLIGDPLRNVKGIEEEKMEAPSTYESEFDKEYDKAASDARAAGTSAAAQRRRDIRGGMKPEAATQLPDGEQKRYEADPLPDDEAAKKRAADRDSMEFATIRDRIKALNEIIKIWMMEFSPPTVHLSALSCNAAAGFRIEVYPSKKYEFDLISIVGFEEIRQKVFSKLEFMKKAVKYIQAAGPQFSYIFEIAAKPELTLTMEYKELTEDVDVQGPRGIPAYTLYKNHVGKDWSLALAFDPIVKFGVEGAIPVALAGGLIGRVAEWLLSKLGVDVDLFIALSLSLSAEVKISRDEHHKWTPPGELLAFKLCLKLEAGFKFKIGDAVEANVKIVSENALILTKFSRAKCKSKKCLLEAVLQGYMEAGIEASAQADVLGLKYERGWSWKPPELRYPPDKNTKAYIARIHLPFLGLI